MWATDDFDYKCEELNIVNMEHIYTTQLCDEFKVNNRSIYIFIE